MPNLLDQMYEAYYNVKKRGKYIEAPTIISTGKQLNKELKTSAFDENNTYTFSSTQDLERYIRENEK